MIGRTRGLSSGKLWPASWRLLYDAGFLFFALFYLPTFFMKGKHHGGLASRFGKIPRNFKRATAGKTVWVHAVSVGEVVQAARLIRALHGRFPEARFVLTVTTTAGFEVARSAGDAQHALWYAPIDFRPCVRAFLRGVSPDVLILMETEIWPNWILESSERRMPVFIVNGRISDRAFVRYRRVKRFLGPLLASLSGVGAQDEAMRQRFVGLGVEPSRARVTGNLKFDWQPDEGKAGMAAEIAGNLKAAGTFLCVAGSTHEGEEAALFGLARSLASKHPGFRLVVAPRHLNRLPAIEAAAASAGVRLKKISECRGPEPDGTVFVLDSMGVLASLYAFTDLVFVGGSLVPAGGHNPIEPAFFEKAVLFGPFMDNFRETVETFTRAGAAAQVKDAAALETAIESLMGDPLKRLAMGTAAKKLVELHRGAIGRNMDAFLNGALSK